MSFLLIFQTTAMAGEQAGDRKDRVIFITEVEASVPSKVWYHCPLIAAHVQLLPIM
jgi:hypothetical protein